MRMGMREKNGRKHMLLFVCTGNVCRSPMAEYMLRKRLGPNSKWTVASAGTFAAFGGRASEQAVKVMAENNIDISSHLSRPVTKQIIQEATIIVTMTREHYETLLQIYPEIREKIFLLKSFGHHKESDVADPIGKEEDAYRQVYDEIEKALPDLIDFLEELSKN